MGPWAPEQRPLISDLTVRLMDEARSGLGHYPSYEHIYLYDAIMITAQILITAGSSCSEALVETITLVSACFTFGFVNCLGRPIFIA